METDSFTSGFVSEEIFRDSCSFSDIREIYVSASGHNRLFRCQRYGKLHVLKALQPLYAGKDFYEQALRKEFNIGYQLEHPHICRTLGWEQVDVLGHCILLEYIDGITLKDFMEQGKLTPVLARKFIMELCSALQYLHSKQIVHRDLKPGNILITHNGNNLKLIDFSLSDCDDYDILKLPAGTRYYLAPEMLQAGSALDLRADIYSLGIIIGEIASQLNDKKLATVSRKCTQRRPERRYASAAEVAQVIAEKERKPVAYRYVMVAVLLLCIAVGGWFLRNNRHPAVETAIFPVYGNLSGGNACRQILATERIRLRQASASQATGAVDLDYQQRKADSLRLIERLAEAMELEFPLPQQRESDGYRQLWNEWLREVAQMMEERARL